MAGLLLSLVSVSTANAEVRAAAVMGPPRTASESALRQAEASGQRVEVVGERSERETVFANPDGQTFTLEKSIVPVRVSQPDGTWTAPDTTLARRADGTVAPRASAADLSFSGGGAGADLVTIGTEGQSVTLGWPGDLPVPQLSGNRATYADVLPDVNLILTATSEGFRQVLEVETLSAASSPRLQSIAYSMKTDGLQVRKGAVGSIEALDANGQVVFRSPSAQMWNSAGDAPGSGQPSAGTAPQSARAVPLTGSPSSAPTGGTTAAPPVEGDPLDGPGKGDESAVMDVAVTQGQLTVTPDAALVAATTAAELPLYLDPAVDLNESERTVLSSDGDAFYNFSGGENGMSVGKCGIGVVNGVSYYCGNGYVNRMYFEFKADGLKGKHVLDAEFKVTETWSFSCDPRWVDLERTNNISSATRWPGPTKLDQMGDRHVSAGRGSLCSPSQPRAPIVFQDNSEEKDENLTPTVKDFANGKFSRLTLMLMAKDETDTVAWKRFDDDAVLVVTYVSKPATPTEYGLAAGAGETCHKSESSPGITTEPQPTLAATPQAASGAESQAQLRVYFDIDVKNSNGTWSDATQPSTGALKPSSGYVGDGADQNLRWTSSLADGKLHRYTAYTWSMYDGYAKHLTSKQTPWCYFKIDSTAPKPPTITFNNTYTACLPGNCTAGGSPGEPGTVTFGPAPGDVNTHYSYMLSGDTEWSDWKAGATYRTTVTPRWAGTSQLRVRARSAAHPLGGGGAAVRFMVGQTPGPSASWNFDESPANTAQAIDTSTTSAAARNNATLSGATRTPQGRRGVLPVTNGTTPRQDQALALNGQNHATTARQVLQTDVSFTVAAWVRLEQTGRNYSVLGQDGQYHSGFYLKYCEDTKKWCAQLADEDTTTTSLSNQRVDAKTPAVTGAWTHLALVVDRQRQMMTLYVNGVLQNWDAAPQASAWPATGRMQIGRVLYRDGYTDEFPGQIDEVKAWQTSMTSEALMEEARLQECGGKPCAELVAHWKPFGASGTTLPDAAGYGRSLTLNSGAQLDGESLVLNGTAGAETAAGPVVDDLGSFTVAVEAQADSAALVNKPNGYRAQVLGQRTATGSSWGLWFEKTGTIEEPVFDEDGNEVIDENTGMPKMTVKPLGYWHFGRLTADGSGVSVQSNDPAALDSEVRLVGAYDAQDSTISLFLTDREGTAQSFTATPGTGGLAAGKGWLTSAWGNYLPGRIGDIRLWAGALADDQQVEAVVGT
ncbi:LamG domain-containing protein [Streptomyces uncialis]|uniref:LamG domain-containing protein n=1 Tax=Streptomyces uncialis TaxID=1048205 RepID=UPI003825A205